MLRHERRRQAPPEDNRADQSYTASNSTEECDPLEGEDAIRSILVTNASSEIKALNEFADGLAEAAEVVISGKRKAEKEESKSTSSTSGEDEADQK
ncbi:hypothetical protein BGZ58_009950 [Dissophora ornata]|nr:hypothetical protein BGZ58_009950 [Dissophora ornata]